MSNQYKFGKKGLKIYTHDPFIAYKDLKRSDLQDALKSISKLTGSYALGIEKEPSKKAPEYKKKIKQKILKQKGLADLVNVSNVLKTKPKPSLSIPNYNKKILKQKGLSDLVNVSDVLQARSKIKKQSKPLFKELKTNVSEKKRVAQVKKNKKSGDNLWVAWKRVYKGFKNQKQQANAYQKWKQKYGY